ncbi:MAG: hypothetical protein ACJAS3_002927 [Roseivirga sp.]|jgi:hypothetical protein
MKTMANKLMVVIKIVIFILSSVTFYLFVSFDLDVMMEKIKSPRFYIELIVSLLFGITMVLLNAKGFRKIVNTKILNTKNQD